MSTKINGRDLKHCTVTESEQAKFNRLCNAVFFALSIGVPAIAFVAFVAKSPVTLF